MNEKKVKRIFDEVLNRFYNAESECIQNYNYGDLEEYTHADLKEDIQMYKKEFESALGVRRN